MDVLDSLSRHRDRDFAELDNLVDEYPGCCLMISKIARVASRSLFINGKSAFRTSVSRVASPFQPAGACSRITRSSSSAKAAFASSSAGHRNVVAGRLARLLNRTIALGWLSSAFGGLPLPLPAMRRTSAPDRPCWLVQSRTLAINGFVSGLASLYEIYSFILILSKLQIKKLVVKT